MIADQSPPQFLRHLEQYTVTDFLEFRASDRLILNPEFQRRDIWKPAAKVYLIDTILRGLPIPKMYFRTIIDPTTQSSVREVVGVGAASRIASPPVGRLSALSRTGTGSLDSRRDTDASLMEEEIGRWRVARDSSRSSELESAAPAPASARTPRLTP
jgi:hypothetical protein